MSDRRSCTLMIVLLAVLLPFLALAQEFRSTAGGRVLDPQGAVIPGAKITATAVETGAKYQGVSGPDGVYVIPFLAPGLYTISAEAKGFQRYVRQGVQISSNERVSLDLDMRVGDMTQSVTVTEETPMLQTSTASVGQVITSRQIDEVPLAGRTPMMLAQLAYGVNVIAEPRYARPFDNQAPSDFSMGGAPVRSNEILLDGAPNTSGSAWKSSGAENRVAYNPPLDAVAEVKVESFQTDAAYGHAGGGTVNVVMRGGTNRLRGSAYEFNQVSRLAATPFFNNSASLKKPVTRYNQWGISSGGPLMIPKVLNGRDKAFFYFVYEGIHDSMPVYGISTVPTDAERAGDFSALLALGSQYTIYDPLQAVKEGTRIRRQAFANNKIPTGRLNPIAVKYLQYYPTSNRWGGADGAENYVSPTNLEIREYAATTGRLDFNLSERHKAFANVRWNDSIGTRGNDLGGAPDGVTAGNGTFRSNAGAMLDDVYAFAPTLVLNTRLNWTRFSEPRPNYSRGFDPTALGFPQYIVANSALPLLPRVAPSGYTGIGSSGGNTLPSDVIQLFSSATKVAGRHTLKAGVDFREYRESTTVFGYSAGNYTFATNWTRGPLDNASSSPLGQGMASFLLGLPTAGSYDVNSARTNHAYYYSLFLQDDLRATRNLTVNVGLRYEQDLPTTERYNRSVKGFDFKTPSSIDAAASSAYNAKPISEIPAGQFHAIGGLTYASASNRELYKTGRYFSPRLGFAWTPEALKGKTVFRAGVGVFIFPILTRGVDLTGFNQQTTMVPTNDGYYSPAATLSDPFPSGILKPTGSALGLATYLGKAVSFYNAAPLNPYSVRWNFGIQQQLAPSLVTEVGYSGNHAVHLAIDRQLNFAPARYLSTSPWRDQTVINRLTANVPNPFAGLMPGTTLDGSVIPVSQLLLPYPQFTSVTAQGMNEGSSYFHQFSARVEKRFGKGFSLLSNYAFSKIIERRTRLNESDPSLEKRVSPDDRPHRIVVSGNWELPFGKGKALASGVNSVVDKIVGGWTVTGIYTWTSGQPIVWGNVIYYGGGLKLDPRRIDKDAQGLGVFDTTRFNTNSAQQLASNIRTFPSTFSNLRYDTANNIDASILKNIVIREGLKLQYRLEGFNVTNRAQFSSSFNPPNVNPTSSAFGTSRTQINLQRRLQMGLRLMW